MPRLTASSTLTAASVFSTADRRRLTDMGLPVDAIKVSMQLSVNPAFPKHVFKATAGDSRLEVSELVNVSMTSKSAEKVTVHQDGHLAFLLNVVGDAAGHELILHFKVKGTARDNPMLWVLRHGSSGRSTSRVEQVEDFDLYVLLPASSDIGEFGRVEQLQLQMPRAAAYVFEGLRVIVFHT